MVTPAKFMLAILAFIAMLIVIGAMAFLPDTGHYASVLNLPTRLSGRGRVPARTPSAAGVSAASCGASP